MEFTISLPETLVRKIKIVASRKGLTINQTVAEMVERGTEDYIYRMQRNSRKAAEQKEDRARLKAMEEKLRELGHEV